MQFAHGTSTHQAIIRVIRDSADTEPTTQLVEALRRGALEPRIRLPAVTTTIDNITPLAIATHHVTDLLLIILQIGIDTHISIRRSRKEPRQHGPLMSEVAGKVHPAVQRILLHQPVDNFPSCIRAAIVHVTHITFPGHLPCLNHRTQQSLQCRRCARQHLFFKITGNHNGQHRCLFHALHSIYSHHSCQACRTENCGRNGETSNLFSFPK